VQLNHLYAHLLERGRRKTINDGGIGLAPKTVRNVHVMLHRALHDAMRWGYLVRNVAEVADPPAARTPEGQRVAGPGRAPGRLPGQGGPGDGHWAAAPAQLGDPEGDKRSVTEIEADEVGASLKWPRPRSNAPASAATATALRGGSGRPSGAATSTTRPHSDQPIFQRPRLSWGRWKIGSNFCDATCWSDPIPTIRAVAHLERSGRAGQRDVTDRE
jgi:hypothetical protein